PSYGKFADKDWPNTEKGFAQMVVNLDHSMEKILGKLKELGIADNTLVIFCSDNGPHSEGGHEMEYFDSNWILRGMKRDLYDGGIRTPFIVRWPKVIKPDQKSSHLSAFWDVLPTLADLVNVEKPDNTDGISFLPILKGNPDQQKKHDYLYWEFPPQGGKQAIVKDKWKAVKLHVNDEKPVIFELYNIESDPGENNNVADKHPEVVEELKALFDEAP
ncbi:MAG: sulfatase/phosphatase domain-containing protein, partial [Bacteroidota bacterium]